MQITDIIRTNSDRLFIVDTECFIIFTGDSLNDEKPFIRIGTWYDLPVEIIPLVENIIVSDKIIGNPSYEQFNIDIRNLEENRYIGGESILKRFLEYQRIFGLDLRNASLVEIEKDIPALPNQKKISNRNQFIGIFYSDGNIKINQGRENIFDLNAINSDNLSCADILDQISINSKNSDRYKGSGFIILNNNPIFYQKGAFTSYQFPDNYFNDFSTLQIDPNYIRDLLLPSDNLINIADFLKFKNNRNGKIKLYSDNTEEIELIKKIFKNATINNERFTNLHINTPDLKVNSYFESPNIKISFSQSGNPGNEISVSFIKSQADVGKILKDKSDMILITYTAYEESALLFKSTVKPVLLIDDGHPNLRKINEAEKIILKTGVQYELKKFDTLDELLNEFKGLDEIKYALENFDEKNIANLINDQLESGESLSVYNILNLLKTLIDHTTDRKKYSALKNIYQSYYQKITFNPDNELRPAIKIIIALYDNTCSTIIAPIQNTYKEKFADAFNEDIINERKISHKQKDTIKRIIEDRERLNRLLKLFYQEISNSPSFNKMKEETSLLKDEIYALRVIYNNDFFLNDGTELNANKKRTTLGSILKKFILNLFSKKNKDNKSNEFKSDKFNEYSINNDSELSRKSKLNDTSEPSDTELSKKNKLNDSTELSENELNRKNKLNDTSEPNDDNELSRKNKLNDSDKFDEYSVHNENELNRKSKLTGENKLYEKNKINTDKKNADKKHTTLGSILKKFILNLFSKKNKDNESNEFYSDKFNEYNINNNNELSRKNKLNDTSELNDNELSRKSKLNDTSELNDNELSRKNKLNDSDKFDEYSAHNDNELRRKNKFTGENKLYEKNKISTNELNADKKHTTLGSIFKKFILNLFSKKNKDNESNEFYSDKFNEYNINNNNELSRKSKLYGDSNKYYENNKINTDELNADNELLKYNELTQDSKSGKNSKLLKNDKLNKKNRLNDDDDNKRSIFQINKKLIIASVLILILLFAIYPFLKNRYFNTDSNTTDSNTQKNITGSNTNNIKAATDSNAQKNITGSNADNIKTAADSNAQKNITGSNADNIKTATDSNTQKNITAQNITNSNTNNIENTNQIFTVKRVNDAEKKILQKYKVEITESDIYRYSNSVALKNGYSEISYDYALKDKNPHWIYPSNIFIMLDGEKVTVQKGDTLWDLSRAKLEKMNADFYKIIDEINKTKNKTKINELIVEAEKYSFMKQQIEILESYKKR